MEDKVTVSIQMKPAYLFDFLYWHSYHGVYGIVNYGFSLAAIAALCFGYGEGSILTTVALILLALSFTVFNPLLLYQKAVNQIKRVSTFQKPIDYSFDENGVTVEQEEAFATAAWEEALLIRETRNTLVIYFGAANAVVLPKKECGEAMQKIKWQILKARPEFEKRLKKDENGRKTERER